MLNKDNHPFHMVDYSPWPLKASLMALMFMLNTTQMFYHPNLLYSLINMTLMLTLPFKWWLDMTREATYQGIHSNNIHNNMKMGMLLFITSEILFFVSFFWAFFHSSLAPTMEIGSLWPPSSIMACNPLSVPLLNTIVLLMSGITLTASHYQMCISNHKKSLLFLTITMMLGLYFTLLQGLEYMDLPYTMADSVFGSTFFIATGFHGLHVIIGTLMLSTSSIRLQKMNFSASHHLGFEASAWYWHFVDVVWLFLYSFLYYWFF